MAKLFLVALCFIGVFAEPPSSYLPPQARNSGRFGQEPSSQYGAPRSSNGYNNQRSHFAPDPSTQYSAPQQRSSYTQQSRFSQQPAAQYNAPRASAPSSRYGAPGRFEDSVTVEAARFGQQRSFSSGNQASSSRFSNNRQAPAQQYNAPAQQYNAPAPRFSAPSQQYGAPRNAQPSQQYGVPSTEYGVPSGRSNMDDDLAEPANYEYNYEVQAGDESGAEFGHQESREDDSARGEYHVLLPDGRMQIVEYEADEEGFRPKIRYEDTGAYPEARDNQGPY